MKRTITKVGLGMAVVGIGAAAPIGATGAGAGAAINPSPPISHKQSFTAPNGCRYEISGEVYNFYNTRFASTKLYSSQPGCDLRNGYTKIRYKVQGEARYADGIPQADVPIYENGDIYNSCHGTLGGWEFGLNWSVNEGRFVPGDCRI